MPARADLGDTYALSCQRYGAAGLVDKADGTITWDRQGYLISEQFHHNQCVAVQYNPDRGGAFTDAMILTFLSKNSLKSQRWMEYPDVTGRSWSTSDDKIYGKFYMDRSKNGKNIVNCLRIAYKNWLERHGLLSKEAPAEERAPVEEEDAQPQSTPIPKATVVY